MKTGLNSFTYFSDHGELLFDSHNNDGQYHSSPHGHQKLPNLKYLSCFGLQINLKKLFLRK